MRSVGVCSRFARRWGRGEEILEIGTFANGHEKLRSSHIGMVDLETKGLQSERKENLPRATFLKPAHD
jgi:hypothetical protein